MARIIISLPDKLLKDLDKHVKKYRYNRSELIRHIIREFLGVEDEKSD